MTSSLSASVCTSVPRLLLCLGLGAGAVASSQAQTTYVKADNTTALNLAGSYVANSGTPTALDTIQVDGTLTASRTATVGNDVSVYAINQTAATAFQFQVGATTGKTLTIGAGGVTKASTTTNAALIFASAVTLGANQTWSIASGTNNNLQMNGAFSDGGYTLSVVGAGTFDLRGSNTFGSNVTIDANTNVNQAGSTVTFGGANTFDVLLINNGKASGATIGNYGVASNFGDGGSSSVITMGGNATNGVFEYTGVTASTNRNFTKDRRGTASGIDVTTAGQTLTITGTLAQTTGGTAIGATSWQMGGAGNLTLNGVISNSSLGDVAGITKNGSGTLTLGAVNTFTGDVIVNAGTVQVSASERIVNTNRMVLAGGTFNVGTFTETLGALDLDGAGGTLNLGTGGTLVFADSSGQSWAGLLTITGAFVSGSSVRFGTSSTGVDSTQLSLISIDGFGSVGIDGSGYLTATAIPEPSTCAALAGVGILAYAGLRRRRSA